MTQDEGLKRRTLLGGGALIAAAGAGGATLWLTACEARRRGAAMKVLTAAQQDALEAFGEALLPGAREAGVAHYIDDQLAKAPADSLLMLRYFDWPPPYAPFYQGGLAALDGFSRARTGKAFRRLDVKAASSLIDVIAAPAAALPDWKGPPASLFYIAVRSDAVDAVYGTVEGFKKLGVPYMPHIEPTRPW